MNYDDLRYILRIFTLCIKTTNKIQQKVKFPPYILALSF